MRVITIEEFDDLGWEAVAQEAKRIVGEGRVYLTFDVDGLDPAYTPGTGTPEAGGITMREAQRLIRAFSGVNLIGGDVVEVSPPLDPSGMTSLNGATILFEILCLLAEHVTLPPIN
uniref:Arginase/agmatinase/formimionoglutamate hydrolase, arginase family n=1 Tax=uncultured gamma proteobacterium HF0130_26L16 TaxID=723569 RepID=E7C390_9GAMM|nr:arginase/agmatinase/formimionoglutamate hydrolase, arginase family [uncultured gamma proteobacterium HF0130_26L16]